MKSSMTGTKIVKKRVCGSRTMCSISLRAIENVRRSVSPVMAGSLGGFGQFAGAITGDGDKNVFEIGSGGANGNVRAGEILQFVALIDESMNRLAEDRRFANRGAMLQ